MCIYIFNKIALGYNVIDLISTQYGHTQRIFCLFVCFLFLLLTVLKYVNQTFECFLKNQIIVFFLYLFMRQKKKF